MNDRIGIKCDLEFIYTACSINAFFLILAQFSEVGKDNDNHYKMTFVVSLDEFLSERL